MKLIFLLPLFLVACASSSKTFDRSETQEKYTEQETKNQERSLARSEIKARIVSLGSQIKSIDTQITNQRRVVREWENRPEVASSEAMVANAKVRIEHLGRERETLLQQQNEWKEKLE